jgi:clan AA aspartic protease (TIGR02281 family)
MDIMTCDFLIYKRSIIVFAQIKGVNDCKELKFILDTGASKTVIDNGAIIRLGFDLKRLNAGDKLMTANGSISSKILKLPKFSLFGKDLSNFEVNVLNMPPQITYIADGLIGMDFLLQFQSIKFNFDEKIIET